MKKIGFVSFVSLAVVLGFFVFPTTTSADDFDVSINATWLQENVTEGCNPVSNPCTGNPTVFDQFSATFEVNASGNLIPGTMVFTLTPGTDTNPGLSGGSFMFDTTPPTFTGAEGTYTVTAPFSWSSSRGEFITFDPTSWPPSGSETLPLSTLDLNCAADACTVGFFDCVDSLCNSGGANAPESGSIIVTAIAPEPPLFVLSLLGPLFILALNSKVSARIRGSWSGSTPLSRTGCC